jgi:hypothetical protein
MRFAILLALCLVVTSARAQDRFEPHLRFFLSAGRSGSRSLWSVDRQLVFVQGTGGQFQQARFDTLTIGKSMRPGLMFGIGATWLMTSKLGLGGEMAWRGINTTQHCRPVAPYYPEAEKLNQQICESIDGRRSTSGRFTFLLHARWGPTQGLVQPFVRFGGGLAIPTSSTAEAIGRVTTASCGTAPTCEYAVYTHPGTGPHPTLALLAGAGIGVRSGRYTTIRLEARDDFLPAPAPVAKAPTVPYNDVRSNWVHIFSIVTAVEIRYEQRRDRRY